MKISIAANPSMPGNRQQKENGPAHGGESGPFFILQEKSRKNQLRLATNSSENTLSKRRFSSWSCSMTTGAILSE